MRRSQLIHCNKFCNNELKYDLPGTIVITPAKNIKARREAGFTWLNSKPVSRVLCSCSAGVSIIYLGLPSLATSSNLPSNIGRATLKCWFTWFYSLRSAQQLQSPTALVSSYLTFSPLPRRIGAVIFFCTFIPLRISSG